MIQKVAILSVLKPVDDVRAYLKIALPLSEKAERVVLMGFESKAKIETERENISFKPLFFHSKHQNRLGYWRFFAGLKALKALIKLRPQSVVVCAIELLPFTLFYKFFFNAKLIYDIQENYFFNIIYQDNYPSFIKHSLAYFVRMTERFASRFIDGFLVAEQTYLDEISFLKHKKLVLLENKLNPSLNIKKIHKSTLGNQIQKFLIYGSFSKTYGTLEGIKLFKKLHQIEPKFKLSLIGYCSDESYLKKLKEETQGLSDIAWLSDGIQAVSHQQLMQNLALHDAIIFPYLTNKSTQNCIPAKFYECLAYQKPMIVRSNDLWKRVLAPYECAIFFDDISQPKKVELLGMQVKETLFYSHPVPKKAYQIEQKTIDELFRLFEMSDS